jgi:hypothetical protein
MLLAGIFPAKQTHQKLVECSETSSSIILTHEKTPSKPASQRVPEKKIAKSYGDVTLVRERVGRYNWPSCATYSDLLLDLPHCQTANRCSRFGNPIFAITIARKLLTYDFKTVSDFSLF